jgi:signal transduction histidine kinase
MTQPKPSSAQTALDDFLDVAGHELRIPLTAMKGRVQLLQRRLRREQEAGQERARDLADLDLIAYQIERLNHELDLYLAAAHITQDRLQIAPEAADLVAIVERLARIYATGAPTHAVRFERLPGSPEALPGMWDRRRVELALGVLLSNAIKYGPDGEVVVRLRPHDEVVRVEVEDQGIGVPPRERRKIFEAYTHGSNVENYGVGLGLYTARAVVQKHGGRMGVRPRASGGSIFWIELPLHPASQPIPTLGGPSLASAAGDEERTQVKSAHSATQPSLTSLPAAGAQP